MDFMTNANFLNVDNMDAIPFLIKDPVFFLNAGYCLSRLPCGSSFMFLKEDLSTIVSMVWSSSFLPKKVDILTTAPRVS